MHNSETVGKATKLHTFKGLPWWISCYMSVVPILFFKVLFIDLRERERAKE